MCCSSFQKKTIFATDSGQVLQCDHQNCYILDFKGQVSLFKVHDFLSFKKRIDGVDIEAMLSDSSRGSDYELVTPFRCTVFFVLNVTDILQLRELLDGAKFIIELNSLLNSKSIRLFSDQEELA